MWTRSEVPHAVSAVQDESLGDNVVAAVMRSGYSLRGKVLRPAMVKVRG